jgi:hypothetical protein
MYEKWGGLEYEWVADKRKGSKTSTFVEHEHSLPSTQNPGNNCTYYKLKLFYTQTHKLTKNTNIPCAYYMIRQCYPSACNPHACCVKYLPSAP